jgi:hypothetical protein
VFFELFESFVELCFLCFFFVFVPFSSVLFGRPALPILCFLLRARAAKDERAGSAKVGPCLTDAAPKAAPGVLSVNESRYAKARTSTSAVAAACCLGGVINTSSLQHMMDVQPASKLAR